MESLSKRSRAILISAAAALLLFLIVYIVGISHYRTRILPGTKLNGVNIGGKTLEEARETLKEAGASYVLVLTGREGVQAQITGESLRLTLEDQGQLAQILDEQKASSWMGALFHRTEISTPVSCNFNAEVLENQLQAMTFLQPENMQMPVNAYVGDGGQKYVVVPESEGTWLEIPTVETAIIQCIQNGVTLLDMDEAGLYTKPVVRMDDPNLNTHAEYLNSLLELTITYDFVDRSYVVDREVIRSWITPDEANNCTLNSDLIAQWVYNMAYETDTFANSHDFTTHNGEQIRLAPGGDYGWAMDQEETVAALLQALADRYSGVLEPSYVFTALDRSSNDIGGTYVEVCLTEQKLYLYENYQLKLVTPVITGCHATGFDTPSGSVWAIDGKKYQMQFTLFDVAVDYWLPFNGDCGLHDASWRNPLEYLNPAYYLTNGSHGCVNTPYDAMETVFETVEIGYPVIVYYSAAEPVGPEPTQDVAVG